MANPLLETERLRLRPLEPSDAEGLEALFAQPVVRRYLLDDEVMPRSWSEEVIAQSQEDFRESAGLFLAEGRESGGIVGLFGYREFFEPPVREIIWVLDTDSQGRGFAVEGARAALAWGFEARGFDPIRASIDSPNAASIRVADRLGFIETGREPGPSGETIHYALARADFTSP